MREYSGWICIGLVLIGVLVLSTTSLAGAGEWVEKAKMPTPRRSTAAVAVNGKIYVIGGASGGWPWQGLSAVEVYDPTTDAWTKKANMPTARFRLSACAVNGRIYAIGGTTSDEVEGALATVEEYDPVADKWTRKADMPAARHGLSTSVVNGKIYAVGGAKEALLEMPTGLDNVEEYDPATDKWVEKAGITIPRYGHAAGVASGKIYIVGGRMGRQKPGAGANTVEEYDPTANKWKEKREAPSIRLFHTVSVAGRKIYAIGGVGDLGGLIVLSSMEEYDPATDRWRKMADMPGERSSVSSAVAKGRIYVLGGWDGWVAGVGGVVYPTVEEYTPEGWSVSPQSKMASTWGMIKTPRY